jgi:hypothetical protein
MPDPSTYKTIHFLRSLGESVAYYRIDQQKDGGAWSEIATLWTVDELWQYMLATGTLDDLAEYAWRIVPLDAAGNECAEPLVLAAELFVREPDAPDFGVMFNSPATTVTFTQ